MPTRPGGLESDGDEEEGDEEDGDERAVPIQCASQ